MKIMLRKDVLSVLLVLILLFAFIMIPTYASADNEDNSPDSNQGYEVDKSTSINQDGTSWTEYDNDQLNDGNGPVKGPVNPIETPSVSLSYISDQTTGNTVVVSGTSSTPCYRMAAKYVHNGVTHWLGEVYSSSYYKTFTADSPGSYTVTLYARSYPETDPRSGSGSASRSFSVYNPVVPSVTVQQISNTYSGYQVTVNASSSTPCYRMAAKYTIGGETHWLGEVLGSTYVKSFYPRGNSICTVTVYARSYQESDPRSASGNSSVSFQILPRTKTVKVFQDVSFLDTFPTSTQSVSSLMNDIKYPFLKKWGLSFSPSFYNIYGMPFESCWKGYYDICQSYTSCGNRCENDNNSQNHDKNFDKNAWFANNNYSYSGYDIMLTLTSASLCHRNTETHAHEMGLGMRLTGYPAALTIEKSDTVIQNVRVIQHEISHMYGCPDHGDGGPCIMNGGFDNDPLFYDDTDIWCSSCKSLFNDFAY